VRFFSKDYFRRKKLGSKPKDYFISFDEYPYFFGVSEEVIRDVTGGWDVMRWRSLDVDIGIFNLEYPGVPDHPEAGEVSLGFTPKQLERLKAYNDSQIAKGEKPYENPHLLGFPYWRILNDMMDEWAGVMSIFDDGFMIRFYSKEHFSKMKWEKKLRYHFISFDEYPCFFGQPEEVIRHVTYCLDVISWPLLNIDINICNFEPVNYDVANR